MIEIFIIKTGEKKLQRIVYIALILSLFSKINFAQTAPALFAHPKVSAGFLLGYTDNIGGNVYGTVSDFSYDLPLSIRFSLGYTVTDAGKPLDARRIFINDATNGTPEESGYIWEFRLDFTYPIKFFSLNKTNFLIGPRYSMFTGNFKFIGGNEFFDITADQWGVGTGVETHLGISPSMSFVAAAGFDYYFQSKLAGHDTAYSPDGQNVNPRKDYSYKDADDAVNQPKFEFRIMGGLNFNF